MIATFGFEGIAVVELLGADDEIVLVLFADNVVVELLLSFGRDVAFDVLVLLIAGNDCALLVVVLS